MSKIGKHLREMRRRRNLPMRELAIRSGISHSTISLIERDRISPTVDTLGAILDALGTTLPGFFSGIHSGVPASPFYPAQDSIEIGNSDSVSYRMIGINFPNRHLLLLRETYAPGADSGEAFAHNAQEAGDRYHWRSRGDGRRPDTRAVAGGRLLFRQPAVAPLPQRRRPTERDRQRGDAANLLRSKYSPWVSTAGEPLLSGEWLVLFYGVS